MTKYPCRIHEIINMLRPCKLICDIGCDHAYVCIRAVQENKAERAIACDINEGPLKRARENISEAGLKDRIAICLSDGLKSVEEKPDACTICGMGGLLIKDILSSSPEMLGSIQQMILGPHSEIPELRKFIEEQTEFRIMKEKVMKEQDQFYVLMDIGKKENGAVLNWTDDEYLTGKSDLQSDPQMYHTYLSFLLNKYENAWKKNNGTSEAARNRKQELFHIVSVIKKAYGTL